MKKKGSICDYIQERNENLKRTFKDCYKSGKQQKVNEIFRHMATLPADRFYISETRALQMITAKRKRGDWKPGINKNKLEMIKEIEQRAEQKMRNDQTLTLEDAVFGVVNSPAPSFYLTPGSMRTIYYDMI